MIEKHYGRYIRDDGDAPLREHVAGKSETLGETFSLEPFRNAIQVAGNVKKGSWWAHLDSNQGPTGYEPVALTN
jgi:hypothetical protein